jgi:hypothetical protein
VFLLTICLLDPPEPGLVEAVGDLSEYDKHVAPAHGPDSFSPFTAKLQSSKLGFDSLVRNITIKVAFLQ